MKKHHVFLFFTLFYFFAHGQDPMVQSWNYQNQINPASYGLLYKHEANAAHNFGPETIGNLTGSLLSYSLYLNKSKIGLGFSFTDQHFKYGSWINTRENRIKAGLNKQVELKNGMILSAGVNLGTAIKLQYDLDPKVPGEIIETNQPIFTSDIGIALHWNRLITMLSVNHFANNGKSYSNREFVNLNGFVSYSFGNKDAIEVCPNIGFNYQQNYEFFQAMVLLKYQSKYYIGTGIVNFVDQWLSTAGITLFDKFRLGYSYSHSYSKLLYNSKPRHEINLAFVLKK